MGTDLLDALIQKYTLIKKGFNGLWHTDEPVFCQFTKKQISTGYIFKTPDTIGVCGIDYFFRTLLPKLFVENESVDICEIESTALPVKKTARIERVKMNIQIRYKILKRDQFRCKACGARAGDVELEIDHIVPVSKGGKTTEENLQTLCSKCNKGKTNIF